MTMEGRPCQANALAFSPDGSSLAACWHDGTVRIVRARQASPFDDEPLVQPARPREGTVP
jgi:WD40 repeat protein